MPGELFGLLVCLCVGALVLGLALIQMRTGSVRFLHSYHYVNVPCASRPLLARESGRWLAAIGVTTIAFGVLFFSLPHDFDALLSVLLTIALAVETVGCVRVIIKYNGSLFG